MKKTWRRVGVGSLAALLVAAGVWVTASSQIGDVAESEISSSSPESAVQGPELTLRKLTSESELIAVGECTEARTAWVEDGRVLVTLATISISEVVKGEPLSSVTVMLPGGADANRRFPVSMTYPGAAQITPNEKVFLFLSTENDLTDDYMVTGGAQGKLSIVTDANGQQVVARDMTQIRLSGSPGAARSTVQFTPLSQLIAQVESYQQ